MADAVLTWLLRAWIAAAVLWNVWAFFVSPRWLDAMRGACRAHIGAVCYLVIPENAVINIANLGAIGVGAGIVFLRAWLRSKRAGFIVKS